MSNGNARVVTLQVGSDESVAPLKPAFSNFLQISRVATEVQFEFLFVDINQVAVTIEKARGSSDKEPVMLSGIPIAKVVVPALSFMQLKDHVIQIFDAIERELGKAPSIKEAHHGSGGAARS